MRCKLRDLAVLNQKSYTAKLGWKYLYYLDTGNITKNVVDSYQKFSIPDKAIPSRAKRLVKNGTIIYSTVRPNQLHYGLLENIPNNLLVSTGFTTIDVNPKFADERYVFYFLTQESITKSLHALAEQSVSTYPSIKADDIGDIEIDLPPLETQKRISKLINSIDEKIKLNSEINDNLIKQAFAIFESKFTDVCNGTHLVSDYILPKRGKGLLSKDAVKGNIPVVAGGLEPSTFHNVANTSAPVLTISASGANAGFIRLWNRPVWSSDSSFIDKNTSEYVYFWYVFLKKRQEEIYGSQTGSAQPHIYPYHIGALPCSELKINDIKSFNDDVTPLFMEIGNNESENLKLANLRDSLLPKLMSGEIDVDSIEL